MSRTTTCPLCATAVDARALHQHKGSRPCKAEQGRERLRENPITRLSRQSNTRRQQYLLEEYGEHAVEEIPIGYSEGSKNNRGRLKTVYCTRTPLAREAQQQVLPSDTGEKQDILADGKSFLLTGDDVNSLTVVEKDGVETTRKRKVRVHQPSLCETPVCYALDGNRIGRVLATDVSPIAIEDYVPDSRVNDLLLRLWGD